MSPDDHETPKVDPWPAAVTADDHPTPHEDECCASGEPELIYLPGQYAMVSEGGSS